MKTAISIPDDLFKSADDLARRQGKSRSQLYAEAMADYLRRHTAVDDTAAMNLVCDAVDGEMDADWAAASVAVLERSEW